MLQQILPELFDRDLAKLKTEISTYSNPDDIWKTAEGISNSGGNLCLHLVGNLKHFVGKTLGNIAYERQRDKEFSDKQVPVSELIRSIDETRQAVISTLKMLSDEDIARVYPIHVFGTPMTTGSFLMHLYGHLNYHLGQVNYHRRLLNK